MFVFWIIKVHWNRNKSRKIRSSSNVDILQRSIFVQSGLPHLISEFETLTSPIAVQPKISLRKFFRKYTTFRLLRNNHPNPKENICISKQKFRIT